MTVNELIEVLMESGDEKFRNTAKVRILNDASSNDWDSWDYVEPDRFDVKHAGNFIDIHARP